MSVRGRRAGRNRLQFRRECHPADRGWKKSFLVIGHPDAGGRSAVLYSILGSCRSRRINTALYLSDVLSRLPDLKTSDIKDYTPEAWIRRHPEARLPRIA